MDLQRIARPEGARPTAPLLLKNLSYLCTMKYEVGDQIIVLHSNEEGRVIEIMNEKMVMIEVRGVKFPAYTDQIDFPYFKRFTEKKLFPEAPKKKVFIDDVPREKKKTTAPREATGVWLAFLPVFRTDEFGDDYVTTLKIHLQNNSPYDLQFTYKLEGHSDTVFELKNQVAAFHDFYLHDVPFEDMNDNPQFWFEFSLNKPIVSKAPYFEAAHKMKAKQLFAKIEQLKEKGEALFAHQLFADYPDRSAEDHAPDLPTADAFDLGKLSASGFKITNKKSRGAESVQTTIDLHIEKLREDWKSMRKGEILDYQLRTFEKHLDKVYMHHLPQLTVIHGVGTGKLKDELHEILKHRKEVKHFVHQYHPWYGYGATEVYFKF